MTAPYTSLDVLKYLARHIRRTVDWTTDGLSGKEIYADEHPEIEAIEDLADETEKLLGPLAEAWDRYSDGRQIMLRVEIENGHHYEHIWYPDPATNVRRTVTGKLIADPGEDNGSYEIEIIPPQTICIQTFPRKLQVVKS
jgi:hypothetical protein